MDPFCADHPNTYDCRSDLGTTYEVVFINDSPPASSLLEEAHQQRRSDRIHRSGRTEARRLSLHRRIGTRHSSSAPITLRSRSIGGCSGNSRGYGPTLRDHQRHRHLSRCIKGQVRRPGWRCPTSRRSDRRPTCTDCQHATRRPMPRSIPPNHLGGESRL